MHNNVGGYKTIMFTIRIQSNALKVLAAKGHDITRLIAGTIVFFNKMQDNYRLQAKSIVNEVVYGAYSPKVYKRTYKLLNSVKTEVIANGFGISIYQDSEMTPTKTTSKHPGYGHYFIEGGGYLQMERMPAELVASLPRDFLGVWVTHFEVVIDRDYRNSVLGMV